MNTKYLLGGCVLFCCLFNLFSDIKSLSETIQFDLNADQSIEMKLTPDGLGLGTTTPAANLHVMGNAYIESLVLGNELEWNRDTVTTNSVLSESFMAPVIFADTSSDNLTLTLPYAGNVLGKSLTIKKKSRLNMLTIQASGGNIDGQSQLHLGGSSKHLPYVELLSEDNQWWIMQSNYWSPKDLPNLSLWLDAMDEASLTMSDGNVTLWQDKSGYHNDVEQSSALNQPAYSNQAVVFDGSNDYLLKTSMDAVDLLGSDLNTACCLMVLQRKGGTVYFKFEVGSTKRFGGEAASRFDFGDATSGGNNLNGWSSSLSTTEFQILVMEKTSHDQNVYLESSLVGNNPNTTPLEEDLGDYSLSVGAQANGSLNAEVDFKEIIFLTDSSATERKKLEGYLAWKWELFSSLPDDHPYKLSPP